MIVRFGGGGMLRVCECGLALIVLWCLAPTAAMAGPPYRTDDPEPTPLGHYEFYTFSTGMVVRDETSGSLPAFELNYGLVPNGQLTIDASVAFDSPSDDSTQFGYGDTPISFKYRFIQEDERSRTRTYDPLIKSQRVHLRFAIRRKSALQAPTGHFAPYRLLGKSWVRRLNGRKSGAP
jgi:hypothetical protein